ncbi:MULTISPECIES: hypothetical protein [unclassified Phenylobacterium]|uniref:hypothetical protein n=1 Tax=unclassified Phenylobacterium TaxID=2640670 RepID=UPI000B315167|nr:MULTISPECIES: hypothetical protein [unclassified Phenylobacterium]
MGERPYIRPVWRTRLAAVLVAWMVLAVSVMLAAARLMEVTPPSVAPMLVLALYVAPPPALLAWSFWHMMREPVTGWLAPTVLMTFCGALIPLAPPIYDLGVRLNFQARRPAYEAIAAEVRDGRIAGLPNRRGWIAGERDGVRFRFRPAERGVIDFTWAEAYGLKAGVRYDDTPCVSRRGALCIDRGERLADRYTYYARFFGGLTSRP